MAIRGLWSLPTAAAMALFACGGSNEKAALSPAGESAVGATANRPPKPVSRVGEIAGAKVYDAHGVAGACAQPRDDCKDAAPEREFLDQCRLASFQVRRCGCEDRCSGDVSAAGRHYDATGNPKECAPARDDCTPPQANASFQDSCGEHGHRLEVCGCEWLCSGNPNP